MYDIAVVGAGPAGIMAAISAARRGKSVVIVEKNNSIGKKIEITGKGRCNVTNSCEVETFIEKFGASGKFLRTAIQKFSNQDLIDFLEGNGVPLKIERQGRVFPASDEAGSIIGALRKAIKKNKIDILYGASLRSAKNNGRFTLFLSSGKAIESEKVILACGGASYPGTGSTGDGFAIARSFGHRVTPLLPGLVPLKTKESWVKKLQGITLKNVIIMFKSGNKKIISPVGEMVFTHFGVSGPLVLDLSGKVLNEFTKKDIKLFIDLKPALGEEKLNERLMREFGAHGKANVKSVMKELIPKNMIDIFLNVARIDKEKTANQVSREERRAILNNLKRFELTITGSLPLEHAMVTSGGVSLKEIDPRTMGSRLIQGLFFAGEIIEGSAPSGGYNLQQAFSTGFLAGDSAGGPKK